VPTKPKKSAAKKTSGKKASPKKQATKKPAKKSAAKRPAAKKAPAKKTTARKAATKPKKAPTAKKSTAQKPSGAKDAAKKPAVKKAAAKPKAAKAAAKPKAVPKEAKPKSPAKAATPKKAPPAAPPVAPAAPATESPVAEALAALVRPGTRILCRMADFDADDTYELFIERVENGLQFSYNEGTVTVTEGALERGIGAVFISQGNASAANDFMQYGRLSAINHTPPFLLSRETLRLLKAGERAPFEMYNSSGELLPPGRPEVYRLTVDGRELEVPVLYARSEDGEHRIWVLDHPTWPWLFKAEFSDDCGVSILEITTGK
jgi:hypothetical protein